jgi:NAD(P)-dependent dehydrogenase (short-subunit alcohol dehydrogenase family)
MRRVALVTGCRSGFGLRTAVEAARAGFVVYAGLRDEATRGELERAAAGLDVTPLQLDVTRAPERDAAVARIEREAGRLDALVNNAGRALGGFLEQIDEDELRELFDVNVLGAWAMTKVCLPLMRASGGGTVVMLSSTSGLSALPCLGAYAATKFAIEGMSEAWRHELRPFGIRVVLVEPGAYRTDIFGRNRRFCRRAFEPGTPYSPYVTGIDRLFERVIDRIARDPDEVSALVVRLLNARAPALRHAVGPGSGLRVLVRRALPFRAVDLVMRLVLGHARRAGGSA